MHRAYGLLVLLIALPAWAAGPIVIGQSLPLTGPAYPIANRIQAGAKALVDRTAKAEPQALVLNLGPEVLDLLSHGGGATREGVPPIVATLSSAGLTQLTRLFRD
ncbi:MAG: hypothetical protein ABI433_07385, partial [Burkholderiaceae bacterium]